MPTINTVGHSRNTFFGFPTLAATTGQPVPPSKPADAGSAEWPDPMDILRDCDLPSGMSTLQMVESLQLKFEIATGRELDWRMALVCLDAIKFSREDVPFPTDFVPIAYHLVDQGYSYEIIHQIVGHIGRKGTVLGCELIHREDLDAVSQLIPTHIRRKASRERFEAFA